MSLKVKGMSLITAHENEAWLPTCLCFHSASESCPMNCQDSGSSRIRSYICIPLGCFTNPTQFDAPISIFRGAESRSWRSGQVAGGARLAYLNFLSNLCSWFLPRLHWPPPSFRKLFPCLREYVDISLLGCSLRLLGDPVPHPVALHLRSPLYSLLVHTNHRMITGNARVTESPRLQQSSCSV